VYKGFFFLKRKKIELRIDEKTPLAPVKRILLATALYIRSPSIQIGIKKIQDPTYSTLFFLQRIRVLCTGIYDCKPHSMDISSLSTRINLQETIFKEKRNRNAMTIWLLSSRETFISKRVVVKVSFTKAEN
jgi:hypothetical protein